MTKIFIMAVLLVSFLETKAQLNEYKAIQTATAPVIDGFGNESCWQSAEWRVLDQVWLGHTPTPQNCSAKYKVCWGKDKIYVLVEVEDDFLVNWNPSEPLQNYPGNDGPEIFIDEDHSGGDHEQNFNAFAYHISTTYNIVDIDSDGTPKLFNEHIEVKRTQVNNTHTWEMAITVYKDNYSYEAGIANEKANLYVGKTMGFTVAYNDSDRNYQSRDAMLASVYIEPWACNLLGYTGAGVNCSWQTASVFGTLTLIDEPLARAEKGEVKQVGLISTDSGWVIHGLQNQENLEVTIYDLNGKLLEKQIVKEGFIKSNTLKEGQFYIIRIQQSGKNFSFKVVK